MSRFTRAALPAIALAAMLYPARSLSASSVVEMSLPEMADHAGQAIVGVVRSIDSYWADEPKRIESRVTFEQVEYLKGALPGADPTFELIVPGGTVGQTRMQLCCAPQFAVGQKWVLLLLPEYQTFPVVGLYQGAFEVVADPAGVERIAHTRHGVRHPVLGLDQQGFVRVASDTNANPADQNMPAGRIKHATGLRVREDGEFAVEPAAMTWVEFSDQLQPILSTSRHHALTLPAGRPAPMRERVGVTLISAENDASPTRTGEIVRPGQVETIDAATTKRGGE